LPQNFQQAHVAIQHVKETFSGKVKQSTRKNRAPSARQKHRGCGSRDGPRSRNTEPAPELNRDGGRSRNAAGVETGKGCEGKQGLPTRRLRKM